MIGRASKRARSVDEKQARQRIQVDRKMSHQQARSLETIVASERPPFGAAVIAVVRGDVEGLAQELARHPSLISERSRSEHSCTLLHYVAANGIEAELQLNADTIYQRLARCSDHDRERLRQKALGVLSVLIDAGADVDALCETYGGGSAQTTMNLLVSSGHPAEARIQSELVRMLAVAGANVDGLDQTGSPLATALMFGYRGVATTLIDCGASLANIVAAAAAGVVADVAVYFDKQGRLKDDVGTSGSLWSPDPKTAAEQALVFAAMCGHLDVVGLLLDRGVDVNAHPPGSHMTGTPLHTTSDLILAKLLVERGADVGSRDSRYHCTPLGWARAFGRADIQEYLQSRDDVAFDDAVQLGMTDRVDEWLRQDPTLATRSFESGCLPLVEAVALPDTRAIGLLLNCGADPRQKDEEGNSALGMARANGNEEIIALLAKSGNR